MSEIRHLSREELEAGLEEIRRSPTDNGLVQMIVARPAVNERIVLEEGELDRVTGLRGDDWQVRGCRDTADGSADPEAQLTIMNARTIALVAQERDRWPLAGDQLIVDLDLSDENLPPGSRLEIGTAVVEITATPHLGCRKFSSRFGTAATRFVNSTEGKQLHLRGVNAKIVRSGTIRVGATARKQKTG